MSPSRLRRYLGWGVGTNGRRARNGRQVGWPRKTRNLPLAGEIFCHSGLCIDLPVSSRIWYLDIDTDRRYPSRRIGHHTL